MATNVTVPGPAGSPITIVYTTADAAALAQTIANAITATAPAAISTVAGSGTTVLPATTTATIITATAPVTIVSTTTTANVLGGTGGMAFFAAPGSLVNVAIAGGSNTVGTGTGSTYTISTGPGNDVVYANGSGSVDVGAGMNIVLLGSGATRVTAYGTGDIIAEASGPSTVSESGTGALVFGGSGTSVDIDNYGTSDTIIGGSGASTMFGGSAGLYFLSSSTTLFVASNAVAPTGSALSSTIVSSLTFLPIVEPQAGSDTIIGSGNGSETVFGGRQDLIFANASSLTFVAAQNDAATINGGAGHDTLYGATGASVSYYSASPGGILVAGSGSETLSAATSSAGVTLVAGSGTAAVGGTTFGYVGVVSNLVLLVPPADDLIGGSGNDTLFGGSGSHTVTGGAGSNTFAFVNGQTGGAELITDFKPGDSVVLIGYGTGEVAAALATATATNAGTAVFGGSTSFAGTTITLADSTKVTFSNTPTLNASNVFGF